MEHEERESSGSHREECRSAKEVLHWVTHELQEFEAKGLPALKTELDAFVAAEDGIVAAYKNAYRDLRDKWCENHRAIVGQHSRIKCSYPGSDWKAIVAECICTNLHDVHCMKRAIRRRKRCCYGPLQAKRERANDRLAVAQARLGVFKDFTTQLTNGLATNKTRIAEVDTLLGDPDTKLQALYKFWFVLLPSHRQLMPGDVSDEMKNFGKDETPLALCKVVWDKECPPDHAPCRPVLADEPHDHQPPERRPAPWLVNPKHFKNELDCAWHDYHMAKREFAAADASFKATPDDLDSLVAQWTAANTNIEATITTCLQGLPSDDPCHEHSTADAEE